MTKYDYPEYAPYYRILVAASGDRAFIACLQDFDETGYDHLPRITERRFDTEEDAIEFCEEICDSSNVPQRIKDLVRPLIPVSYSVDKFLGQLSGGNQDA